jgi:OPA family sugar phosphate sensor protein UhpC-like MFS transporter
MISLIRNFFKPADYKQIEMSADEISYKYNRLRWSVFLSATFGYGFYYVCRLSLNVIKKPLIERGYLSESELGIIGSTLFFAYAIGKLTNGFLADRSNIKKFMSVGLLASAIINLLLGFTSTFYLFALLWGLNGWFQSMGATPAIISLTRWFSNKERGTFYGFFSASHNIGEATTFIVTALFVTTFGWQWGFWGAGFIGLLGVAIIAFYLHDSPESIGLPSITSYKEDYSTKPPEKKSISTLQIEVLKNPYIWILALASSFMYVSRYAVNSWGILFLESHKNYTTLQASSIISISSISGIIGNIISGLISDKFFAGKRNMPALIFGILNAFSLALFFFSPPGNLWVDVFCMVVFGLAIGVLICFLGGLMAVDIASKSAAGTAVGIIGIASYIGAAIQDILSGLLIENNKTLINGVVRYNFTSVSYLWIGAAIISFLLAIFVWNVKAKD